MSTDVVVVTVPNQVTVAEPDGGTVTVALPGDTGADVVTVGVQGPPGPQGTAGAGVFIWQQAMPSAVWTIAHNFGRKVASVRSVDSAGTEMEGDWLDVDNNHGTLTFGAAFSGTAFLI